MTGRISSYCGGGACVAVDLADPVTVWATQAPEQRVTFGREPWAAFVEWVTNGPAETEGQR